MTFYYLIYLFNICVWSTSCKPGNVLGPGHIAMGMGDKVSAFRDRELRVQGEADSKEMNKLPLDSNNYYEENKLGRNDGEGLKPRALLRGNRT